MIAKRFARALDAFAAVLLVVSLTACSTTKPVRLGSPELSELNRHARSTKSLVTLRDGGKLEVEGLQVDVEQARGALRRQLPAPGYDGQRPRWRDVAPEARALAIAPSEIARVELRSGRAKGGWLGAIGGLLVGGGLGIPIGYAATPDRNCIPYFYSNTYCTMPGPELEGALIGAIVGGVVGAVAGGLIGSRGVARSYVFEEFAPTPTPELAPSASPPPAP